MRRGFEGVALRQFTRLFESGTLSAASDRELLDEFARRRDDSAFEVLMTRYGRLVLNVGRKLLHDPRDVEDAFQATFLVLVRKPPRLRVGESLGPWMSTVAYRVAARARANRIRLNRMETTDGLETAASADPVADANALALHEELSRLPERLRRPVVCCYLEGLTHEHAAERLGCPVGTVRSRLARARLVLQRRLVSRGVAPAVAPLEVLFTSSNSIEPPVRLVDQTMRVVATSHAHWPEVGVVSASLLSLVNGVVRMMNLKKALVALSVTLPLGGLVAVGAAQAYQQATDGPDKIVVGGKTYVADPEGPWTYPVTYYVGDLLGPSPSRARQQDGKPASRPGPDVDLSAVIELIGRNVAPGTWRVLDVSGKDMTTSLGLGQGREGGQESRIGSITPFFLSISLIIRHTAAVHEQVGDLLRNVRSIANAAVARAAKMPTDVVKTAQAGGDLFQGVLNGAIMPPNIKVDGSPTNLDSFPPPIAPADPATIKGEGKKLHSLNPNKFRMMKMRGQLKVLQSEMEALEEDLMKSEIEKSAPATPAREGTPKENPKES